VFGKYLSDKYPQSLMLLAYNFISLNWQILQRLYYSGNFQMFYQKAAVWGRWCLNLVFSDFMHHCVPIQAEAGCRW